MKKLSLAATFLAAGLIGAPAFGHGGQYRGPGDTVPPGGGGSGGGGAGPGSGPAGPSGPGPSGPATPGTPAPGAPAGAGNAPVTQGGAVGGPDLTLWSFWWEFNKEPYLNLKSHIHGGNVDSGSEGFFLGRGQQEQGKDTFKPTEQQIRQKVVPALLNALENETNNDIVTGCMIALAKIGDANTESGESEFEKVLAGFLSDNNQEISETAAVSLGILANPSSIDTLEALLNDTAEARRLVNQTEVNYRTRSFAAYGLGLIGFQPATSSEARKRIVTILDDAIKNDDTRSRDLKVSCIIAMGLVPLEQIDAAPAEGEEDAAQPPHVSRSAQIQYLLDFMQDDSNNYLIRAHCPTAMARLLEGMPAERYEEWRGKIAAVLGERMQKRGPEKQREVIQSCVLASGLICTNGKEDADLRKTLMAVPEEISDQQAKNFSMIAVAKAGGNPGVEDKESGIKDSGEFLLKQLSRGSSTVKPWAGLSIGVLGYELKKDTQMAATGTLTDLSQALRTSLEEEGDKSRVGAYAIGAGIMGDVESTGILMEKLEKISDDEARGYVAVSLGLIGAREAIEKIQEIVADSKYRPDLLKQAAIALGLLGDKDLVDNLVVMLGESKSLATQAALSSALGFIGDGRSIDPLIEMLGNDDLTETARGFAAVALGIVADKELLPWNTKIALDLNYRASTQTLVDAQGGTGILDIL